MRKEGAGPPQAFFSQIPIFLRKSTLSEARDFFSNPAREGLFFNVYYSACTPTGRMVAMSMRAPTS